MKKPIISNKINNTILSELIYAPIRNISKGNVIIAKKSHILFELKFECPIVITIIFPNKKYIMLVIITILFFIFKI